MKKVSEYKKFVEAMFNLREADGRTIPGAPIAQPKDRRVSNDPQVTPAGNPPTPGPVGSVPSSHEDEYTQDLEKLAKPGNVKAKTKLGKLMVNILGARVEPKFGKKKTESLQQRRNKVRKEDTAPSLAHGGGTSSSAYQTSTYLPKSNLTPVEVDVVDKYESEILKFAEEAYKGKPLPVARRLVIKKLESLGITNKNSGRMADVLAHLYGVDSDPEIHTFQRVLPRIAQIPNVKGGAFYQGGSPGAWQPLG
jgi:hypothetical protein